MHDPRNDDLAEVIVRHSLALAPGENVLILGTGLTAEPLVRCLIKAVRAAGARPFYRLDNEPTKRAWLMGIDDATLSLMAEADAFLMERMDAFVGFSSPDNALELSDVPGAAMSRYQSLYYKPVHYDIRVPKTRWAVLRYPAPAFAQSAGMSEEAFEDWFYRVCTVDYGRMEKALGPLRELMERTDRVRVTGPGTDLSFSIAGIPAIPCAGKVNLPDGEIYTAPVRDSVEGVLSYNAPSILDGFRYSGIRFRFEKGRIVEATANDAARINTVLDTDEGARYVGEFAIGVNPYVDRPVGNTLFDEKIRGSIHFTPGNSYDDAFNGNRSAVHWDLVLLQDAASGGGEIWFDGVLVRKDGLFVLPELEDLNPDRLG